MSQQQQIQQQQKQQLDICCDYCHSKIPDKGKFIVFKNQLLFFDSSRCKLYYFLRVDGRQRKLERKLARIRKCEYCSKEFDPRSQYSQQRFCSKSCFCQAENPKKPSPYINSYYCDFCEKWIPKENAVCKTFILTNRAVCPNRSCNNNKLRNRKAKQQK